MSSSNLSFDPLRQPSTLSSLQTLTSVLETSIGPTGKLKLLENTHQLTSSSQRLFSSISIKNTFSKIIISTAKTQLRTFNDGGLFCGLLTLKLVCPSATDNGHSLPLVGTLYEYFATQFLNLLKEESSFAVDFSDLKHLKSVVLTVLSSKPGCVLSRWDRHHLCSLLLRAFLGSIPSSGVSAPLQDCFRFFTVDGLPTKDSRLIKGTLVLIPEAERMRFIEKIARQAGRPIKMALFTCSLAGDADWPVERLETTSLDLVINSTLQLLDKVISQLVLDGVDFVFCQKVVHPRMRKRLQKVGIMILDRLGSEVAKCIWYISGGNSIASLACELSYGTISSISIEHLGTKSFLLLANSETPLFTIVLAHYNEEASAELKIVCRQALDSLLRILVSSRLCFGGGCSEIQTVLHLANKVRSNLDAIKQETDCTAGQVLESLSTFLRAIANTCVALHQGKILDFATDGIHGHLWKLQSGHFPTARNRCQCGNQEAASVDPSSWSLLSDIGHLYEVIPSTSKSSNMSFIKVLPTLTPTDESLDVCNSGTKNTKPKVALSSNPMPNFQLPSSTISSAKCTPLSNSVTTKLESAYQLPTTFNSSTITMPNSFPRKSEAACQLSTNASSLIYVALPGTIPSCQLFAKVETSLISISSSDLLVTSSSRNSQLTSSDKTDSVYLDELTCKLNSFSLAFETAALLLRTTVCINKLST